MTVDIKSVAGWPRSHPRSAYSTQGTAGNKLDRKWGRARIYAAWQSSTSSKKPLLAHGYADKTCVYGDACVDEVGTVISGWSAPRRNLHWRDWRLLIDSLSDPNDSCNWLDVSLFTWFNYSHLRGENLIRSFICFFFKFSSAIFHRNKAALDVELPPFEMGGGEGEDWGERGSYNLALY